MSGSGAFDGLMVLSRSFARSTRRLCERRKSAPMIGWVTSAMMKCHEYFLEAKVEHHLAGAKCFDW